MGGLTSWRTRRPLTPRQSLIVSVSGPLAGFALAGVVVLLHPMLFADPSRLTRVVIFDLIWVNVAWGIFNLLPIQPLDGGQATRSLVHLFRGRTDEILPLQISIFAGVLISFWLLVVWQQFLAAALIGYMLYHNYQALRGHLGRSGGQRFG